MLKHFQVVLNPDHQMDHVSRRDPDYESYLAFDCNLAKENPIGRDGTWNQGLLTSIV